MTPNAWRIGSVMLDLANREWNPSIRVQVTDANVSAASGLDVADATALRDALTAAITEANELIRAREVEMRLAGPQQEMGGAVAGSVVGASLEQQLLQQYVASRQQARAAAKVAKP